MPAVNDALTLDEVASSANGQLFSRRNTGLAITFAALLCGIVTFLLLAGLTPIVPTYTIAIVASYVNGAIILALIAFVGWEIYLLFQAVKNRRPGSRLQFRIVALFSVIAVTPAIILAILAAFTLYLGFERWFNNATRSIIQNAISLAYVYRIDQVQQLRGDLEVISQNLEQSHELYFNDPLRFDVFFAQQLKARDVPYAALLNDKGETVLHMGNARVLNNIRLPATALERAASMPDNIAMIDSGHSNIFGGIKKLDNFRNTYLFVIRAIDDRVAEHLGQLRLNSQAYRELSETHTGVQLAFGLVFAGFALILLLTSIRVGIELAARLVLPIRRLIYASDQISEGNLEIEVPVKDEKHDIDSLTRTFNNMSRELRNQHGKLMEANMLNSRRRDFIEAVLSGVTSGVIGVNHDGHISLVNPSALAILEEKKNNLEGHNLATAIPEMAEAFHTFIAEKRKNWQQQLKLTRKSKELIINLRITSEDAMAADGGFVLTMEDISDLVSAQKKSAWGDVARRIAHEIKNPLTPISLSAERLRRRYKKQIESDDEIFDQCIDTIVRQVSDIGRMVDEFSGFSRMPKPSFEQHDLSISIREAVFLHSVSHGNIEFEISGADEAVTARYDHRLMVQALGNVVKNAAESTESVHKNNSGGKVAVALFQQEGRFVIEVCDNGRGWPKENRADLLEPYVTTRDRGTGLGLPIVQKIMEEHGGDIELLDPDDNLSGEKATGAKVRLWFSCDL